MCRSKLTCHKIVTSIPQARYSVVGEVHFPIKLIVSWLIWFIIQESCKMNLEDEKRKLRLAVRDGENGEKKLSKTLVTAATPMKSAILKGTAALRV